MSRLKTWFAAVAAFFTPSCEVRKEVLSGETCYCIYRRRFGRLVFLERWSTLAGAARRLVELTGTTPMGTPVPAEQIAEALALAPPPRPVPSLVSSKQRLFDIGESARLVLENPAFNEALRLMRDEAAAAQKKCPIRDEEGQRLLAQAARLTDAVEQTLRGMLEAGKMAKAQIDIDSARNEARKQPVLRKVL